VVRRLRLTGSRVKIVIVSDSKDRAPMMEALRTGADGYLSIDDPPHQLWNAVRLVRTGGTYVSPLLRNRFGRGRKAKVENPADSLDPHEMEVFSFLTNGLQSQDIADLLEISLSVVEALRTSLMRKLMISGEGTTAIQSRHASNLASLRSEEKRVYSLLADGFPPNEIAERMAISLERFYTLRFRVMQKLNLQSFDFEPPELA
jgi:DNA-binding NarL/FixJ family response regulator